MIAPDRKPIQEVDSIAYRSFHHGPSCRGNIIDRYGIWGRSRSFGDGRAAICQPQFALVCTSVVCFDSAQQ